jgi:thiol:disulfide interchange protein DsbC
MKRHLLAAVALFAMVPFAHASEKNEAAVRAAVQKLVPNVKIDAVEKSPIEGYYQVIVGSQLVYVSVDGQYVLQGTLYDANAKVDVTAERMAREHIAKLDAYPEAQRIIFAPKTKAKYKVTVFTDIDCGYCRKMHSHIAEYNERGIEVDYLFFPRSGPGTPSFDKAVSVWCAKDRKQAFTSAKSGQDPSPLKCENPVAQEYQLGITVGVDGTPAVYAQDGSKIGGYLTPDQLQAQLERIAAATSKSGA